ncbi:NAD(P)-binding Rossmann-fold superfamily protein isoform X3 [Carex rostrata]
MLAVLVFLLSLSAVAAILFKFAKADGDFTLLSKGPAKRKAVEGKVVWITGASRGIGEVLATQFAALGAKLILSARNKEELERVKYEITSKYPAAGVEVLPLDLSSGEEVLKKSVQEAESLFSDAGVDFMIHNAAFERPMSSAAGKTPAPGQALYSASKHALNGYFHTLRSELCQKGIGVTVICPGPIQTENSSGGSEKRVPSERCCELTIVAATHGLKEAWISYQPVLLVMYLVQYMPTVGYWLMDKIGANRIDAAAKKGNAYSWDLLFKKKKST